MSTPTRNDTEAPEHREPLLLVEPGPAAAHVRALMADNWRLADIANVSGVSVPTIGRIANGRVKTLIRIDTAEALLGTTTALSHKRTPPIEVDAVGTRRRLRALAAQGWSFRELMRRIDRTYSFASWLTTTPRVHVDTKKRVSDLYDELWDKEPPRRTPEENRVYNATVRHARARGWAGPLAWDNIDDPNEQPNVVGGERDDQAIDEVAIERAFREGTKVTLTYAEKRVAVARAHKRRWSDAVIADRLGVTERTVLRIRGELDLAAWPMEDQINARGQRYAA